MLHWELQLRVEALKLRFLNHDLRSAVNFSKRPEAGQNSHQTENCFSQLAAIIVDNTTWNMWAIFCVIPLKASSLPSFTPERPCYSLTADVSTVATLASLQTSRHCEVGNGFSFCLVKWWSNQKILQIRFGELYFMLLGFHTFLCNRSRTGLCDGPIPRPKESYRVCVCVCVCVCHWVSSRETNNLYTYNE
jgi:hypothetical protein